MKEVMGDIMTVLEQYDIEVAGIKTESYKEKKGVWWIDTPQGYRILKKHSNSKETVEFIISSVYYLKNNGVNIPDIVKTKENSSYVYWDNHCYVMSKAVTGNNPRYENTEELKRVVHEMARFHSASSGFEPPKGCKSRVHLGGWVEDYRNRSEKLRGYFAKEEKNVGCSAFGETILKEFPHFYSRMQEAAALLVESCYFEWVDEIADKKSLCHQDFAAGNLILTDSGEMFVLDTDSITIDIPIRDIRKLLNKVMKKRGTWDIELVRKMLEWYQDKNPLEASRWQVLKADLSYPHLFEGIMSKYYEKREKSWTQDKYIKRLNEMIKIERLVEPIIDCFDNLIPV